jgi:hypothetical protein
LALVPLTNSFQAFAGAPPANTAYQVTEFVANPPILQLSSAPVHQVQLVLYGLTNTTYQIQTNGSLLTSGAWVAAGTVSMTNSFRILPPATPTTNMLFYRAKQQ